jgi:hypothetical protein
MAVVFEARVKVDDTEKWYIELTDKVDNRVEICNDLDEFETKVEELGSDYGGRIDEVKWLKDDDVLPHVMDDLRAQMALKREKLEEDRDEPLTPFAEEVTPEESE